jgi:tRNA nucleotidyltransferase (CCA-adding enzyme)
MPTFSTPVPQEVLSVVSTLRRHGHEAFVVGGCVRDLLLGRRPKDWDVTTDALPQQTVALFSRVIPTGMKHGTVTVLSGGEPIEVTTYRKSGHALSEDSTCAVQPGVTLLEDLAHRDFTMNAIALDPVADKLVDPFLGAAAIAERRISAAGRATERFAEDALRAMRALRFMATLGFVLDDEVTAAIATARQGLSGVSVERFRDELLKILAAEQPRDALRLAQRTGALGVFLPELDAGVGCTQNRHHKYDVFLHTLVTVEHTAGDAIRRLGALLHDVGKPGTRLPYDDRPEEFSFLRHEQLGAEMTAAITARLKLSTDEQRRVVGMVEHHMFAADPDQKPASLRRFLRRVGPELVPDLLALRIGDIVGKGMGEDANAKLAPFIAALTRVQNEPRLLSTRDLAVTGKDVMQKLALPPGPRVGELLASLLEQVTENPELNTREALLALLAELPNRC